MKKQLKLIFLCTCLLFLGIGAFSYLRWQGNREMAMNHREAENKWKTFNKVSNKEIKSYPTTEKERKDFKLDEDDHSHDSHQSKKRSVASQKTTPEKDPNLRPWKGIGARPLSSEIDNEYNPEWKEELGKNLLRFLRPKTLSVIKRENSALIKHKGKYLMVEHVAIKLQSPEGQHYGYNAYVDSASGKIIRTWNRTIHEKFSRSALRLSPSRN
jgi:hypothetical protein